MSKSPHVKTWLPAIGWRYFSIVKKIDHFAIGWPWRWEVCLKGGGSPKIARPMTTVLYVGVFKKIWLQVSSCSYISTRASKGAWIGIVTDSIIDYYTTSGYPRPSDTVKSPKSEWGKGGQAKKTKLSNIFISTIPPTRKSPSIALVFIGLS